MLEYIDRLRARRDRVADREGSPIYPFSFGALAASGGREYLEIRDSIPAARKYEPLDFVELTNTSGQLLDIEINGADFGTVPGNFNLIIRDQAIWSLALTNNTVTAVGAAAVRARFQREPMTADKAARLQL